MAKIKKSLEVTSNPVKKGKFECNKCGLNFMKIYPMGLKQYCKKCFDQNLYK